MIKQPDIKVNKSNKQTIFEGLNLISENICDRYYLHNYPLGFGTFILDYYYNKEYSCQICPKTFVFNKYITFWKCYYSINGEPEKSTGLPNNVVKFMVIPGTNLVLMKLLTLLF